MELLNFLKQIPFPVLLVAVLILLVVTLVIAFQYAKHKGLEGIREQVYQLILKAEHMISCGVIMLMIDTTTISIVCWAIPDLFDRIGCDVLIFFHGIEQVFTNWQTPTIFSASNCQGIINNFLPTIHEVY